ncbi:hypothetical protein CCS38_25465 [Streptomyces purpurogeneiscleroticus]|nr:hypothetical protein [Streptomyces purpurogeneiscleroticus]
MDEAAFSARESLELCCEVLPHDRAVAVHIKADRAEAARPGQTQEPAGSDAQQLGTLRRADDADPLTQRVRESLFLPQPLDLRRRHPPSAGRGARPRQDRHHFLELRGELELACFQS